MEQIAKIGAYITVPDCATTGTVKNIKEGSGDAIGQEAVVDELYTAIDRSHIIIISLSNNQSVNMQHNPRAALGEVKVVQFLILNVGTIARMSGPCFQ